MFMKKVISLILCVAMLLTAAPLQGFAAIAENGSAYQGEDNMINATKPVGDVESLVIDPTVKVDEVDYQAGNVTDELRVPFKEFQTSEPEVNGQLIQVDQFSKTYQTGERTYTTVYDSTPNFYVDENGAEQAYDNSLVLDSGKDAAFTNASGEIDVRFSTDLAEKGLTFEYDGIRVGMIPVDGNYDTYLIVDEAVRYNNVYDGIDVQYTVDKQGVREYIILNKEVEKNTFSYKLNLNGHYVKLSENVLYVYDSKDSEEHAFTIAAPVMTDAAGIVSKDIELTLDGDILTLTADAEWLHAAERAYPVIIDPDITIDYSGIQLRTVCSDGDRVYVAGTPYAYGYAGYMVGKYFGVPGQDLEHTKMIISFSDDHFNSIPEGAGITSAEFNIFQYVGFPNASTPTVFDCFMIHTDWSVSDYSQGTAISKAYTTVGTFEKEYLSSSKTKATNNPGYHQFDVTDAVKSWINWPETRNGLMITSKNNSESETAGAFITPTSSTNIQTHANKKPFLRITWEIPNPVDENYDINNTTINLRTIGTSSRDGKLAILGVFADGVAKPNSVINYVFSDASAENQTASTNANVSYKYPDSSAWDEAFASQGRATRYKDILSNWQTLVPFTQFNYNQIYNWTATATKDGVTGNTAKSVDFLVYKITRYDTLASIANYYGVSLDQLAKDNHVQDMLLVENNTIIVINPTKNATTPYNPAPLTDAEKERIDGLLMGRSKHCEFGFEPVNLNTGNFYMNQTDVTIPDYNGDFVLERTYNSKGADINSVFGRGWQFEYAETLAKPTVDSFAYRRGDGSTINFYKQSDSLYVSDIGFNMTLTPVKVGEAMGDFGGEEPEAYDIFEYEIRMSDGEVRRFSSRGLLKSITDDKGFVTTITYDVNNNFASIISPAGQCYTISSNMEGKITSILLPNGEHVGYEYDDQGNLVAYINELGYKTTYNYDNNHLMTSWADAEGNVIVTNTYDAEGRVVKQADANGDETLFAYGDHTTTTTDANGNVTVYQYDELYRTKKITYADGTYESKTYDDAGNLASATDRNGNTTTYTYNNDGYVLTETRFDGAVKNYAYDAANRVTAIKDFDGASTTYAYDAKGNILTQTAKDGTVSSYKYDDNCRMTKQTDANGNSIVYAYDGIWVSSITNAEKAVEKYYYDTMGRVVTKIDALGNQTRYFYDEAGRNIGYQTADGNTVTYTYDKAGCMKTLKNASGYVYSYDYDGMGNIVALTDPLNNTVTFSYDGLYNTTSTVYDAEHVVSTVYDAFSLPVSETDEEGNTVYYTYDGVGNVLTRTDANGNVTTYSYDLRFNKPTVIVDANGGKTTNEYDDAGNLISVVDANGNKTEYTYDNAGNVLTITYPNSLIESFVYDNMGNVVEKKINNDEQDKTIYTYNNVYALTSVEFANGATIAYTYDALGNKLTETDSAGAVTMFTYDTMGRVATMTDAIGRKTTYTYDANGNVLAEQYSNGGKKEYTYDALDRVCKETDGLGNSTYYAYDGVGNLLSVTDALANVVTYSYTKTGLVKAVTDAMGAVTATEYDANGNVIATTDANGNVVTMSYDKLNRLVSASDATGLVKTYTYDAVGNVISESDNQGVEKTYEYDSMNNLVSVVDPLQNETVYAYDIKGLLTGVKDAAGGQTSYSYDIMGNRLTSTDANNNTTKYTYDIVGNLLSVTNPLGVVTSYQYDIVGRTIASTTAENHTTKYEYNDFDFVVKETDSAENTIEKVYDICGNLISETDKNGNRTQYTYNAIYQLIKITYADGSENLFEYDPNGNMTSRTDANGNKTVYAYDNVGNCTSITDPEGGVYQYTYDANGNVLIATDPNGNTTTYTYELSYGLTASETDALSGVTSYTYDENGQLLAQTDANGNTTTYTYDVVGNITSVTYPGGLKHTYTYDKVGNLLADETNAGEKMTFTYDAIYNNTSVTYPNGAQLVYTYDVFGNKLTEKDSAGAVTTYAYDALNRNVSVEDAIGRKIIYTYDANGNVLTETASNGGVTSYVYDARNRAVKITDALQHSTVMSYDPNGNVLTSTDARGATTAYTYTKNGYVQTVTDSLGAVTTMEYDPVGNLTKVTDAEGFVATMSYDALNRTATVTDALGLTTTYAYDAVGNLIEESNNNNGKTAFAYSPAGYLIQSIDALNNVTAYTYDLKGQLTQVTDANNAVTKYTYDNMGNLVSMTDAEGGVTTMEYDIVGNNTKQTDAMGGTYTFTYDAVGRVLQSVDPLGLSTQYQYNAFDYVTKTIDANGNVTEKEYDIGGNLVAETDANGNKTRYVYDAVYNLAQVIYADKTTNSFEYDLNGSLVKAVDGNGNATTFAYNKLGYRVAETNARNFTTKFTYNANGDVLTEIDALGQVTTYSYDKSGNLVSQKLANGATYGFAYDALGRVTKQTMPEGQFDVFTYDAVGNTVLVTDETDRKTAYTYDKLGRLLTSTDAKGNETAFTYDKLGNMVSMTTPNGTVTTYEYDANSRLTGTAAPDTAVVKYSYDGVGNLVSTDNGGRITGFTYDKVGNQTAETNALGKTKKYTFDALNRVITETDYKGKETKYTYDANDNLTSVTNRLGEKTTYSYDQVNNLTGEVDAGGHSILYGYNELNWLVAVNEGGVPSVYEYDSVGNLTSAGGFTYTYNLNGEILTATNAIGNVTEYVYNQNGMLAQIVNADKTTVNYDYDALDTLISKTYDDGEQVALYAYDANGNRVSMTDIAGVTSYEYDDAGRVTAIILYNGVSRVTYKYNEFGELVELGYPDATKVYYSYDALGRLTEMTDRDGGKVTYVYDDNSNLTEVHRPNETASFISYDDEDRVVSIENHGHITFLWWKLKSVVSSRYTYTYDKSGNIVSENVYEFISENDFLDLLTYLFTRLKNVHSTKEYTYDARNQLTGVVESEQMWFKKTVATEIYYDYDLSGNRTGKTENGIETVYTYNEAGQLLSEATGETVITYTYDANGNLISESKPDCLCGTDVKTYAYDNENRLQAVKENGSLLMAMLYDGDGVRTFTAEKTEDPCKVVSNAFELSPLPGFFNSASDKFGSNGNSSEADSDIYDLLLVPHGVKTVNYAFYDLTEYINNVNTEYTQVLLERAANNTTKAVYEYGIFRERAEIDGQDYTYEYDGRGSVTALTLSNAKKVTTYSYDAYGVTTSAGLCVDNPYQYNAEYTDELTDLQYLRARYYRAQTGSFITEDTYKGDITTPLSLNRYTYTHNNPLVNKDPSGHGLFGALVGGIAGAVVGAVAGAAGEIYSSIKTGQKIDLKAVGKKALSGAASGALVGAAFGLAPVATTCVLVAAATIKTGVDAHNYNKLIQQQTNKISAAEKNATVYSGNSYSGSGFSYYNAQANKTVVFASYQEYLNYVSLCEGKESLEKQKVSTLKHDALGILEVIPIASIPATIVDVKMYHDEADAAMKEGNTELAEQYYDAAASKTVGVIGGRLVGKGLQKSAQTEGSWLNTVGQKLTYNPNSTSNTKLQLIDKSITMKDANLGLKIDNVLGTDLTGYYYKDSTINWVKEENAKAEVIQQQQLIANKTAQDYNATRSPYERGVEKGLTDITKTENNGVSFRDSEALYKTENGKKAIVSIEATGKRNKDFQLADQWLKEQGVDSRPKGYTWHHVDDYNVKTNKLTLELVLTDAHEKTYPHSGAAAMYDAVYGPSYNK